MSGQEAFRQLQSRLQKFSSGGGGGPGPKGVLTGTGALVLLIAGGLAVNASLFNGTCVVGEGDVGAVL